jgi:hypothetical protein
MDNLFKIRVLTAAVNEIMAPARKVYNKFFAGREHMEPSDRLAFDVITGSQKLLGNISIFAPATVTDKTGRKTITLTAPRLANKRMIHTAELNATRAFGDQVSVEMMKDRIARELKDMRNEHDRTLEFWACNALKGIIYDRDMSTVLVNYNMDATHTPTLEGTDLWTAAASDPIAKIRSWKRLIEDDSNAAITGWEAIVGFNAMSALLTNSSVLTLLKYEKGRRMAEEGDVERLAGVALEEYSGSYLDDAGGRQRFIGDDYFMLVGMCEDLTDVPYAPIVDDAAPGGVGNIDATGRGVMFFSKSWANEDPSGRWIKAETRPIPVLQRPGAVIYAKVV